MSQRNDLTRWNRAGLSRFDYVDGNAVEYLEILRQQLIRHFADPVTGECAWINPPQKIPANEVEVEGETLVQRQQRLSIRNRRLLETYQQDRRDWAWEISRSFARCCHMLTEHANAYANEGFLGTATQWEHVRRLVEMLDYHPAPPASASTWISIRAKAGMHGTIAKGLQIKNSPAAGADKVIFETLQDIYIDAAFNELRPLGWDISAQPLSAAVSEVASPALTLLSEVLQKPAIYLDGVGSIQSAKLDTLKPGTGFKIRDFLNLNPDQVAIGIHATSLWDWKAKANYLFNFSPAGDWSSLANKTLQEIENTSAEELAQSSGNSIDMAIAMKQTLDMVEVCLDHPRFEELQWRHLIAPDTAEQSYVQTNWYIPSKPQVEEGEVALIVDENHHRAEAVSINRVTEVAGEPSCLQLDLLPSPLQKSWNEWAKGDALLHYATRWNKKCWLNGANVIRTQEAHGLTADSYVGWKVAGQWYYAQVIEVDKRDLRLDYTGAMPAAGKDLFLLSPIAGNIAAANLEVVVLLDEGGILGDEKSAVEPVIPEIKPSPFDSIFTIDDTKTETIGGGGLLPPAALPKIGSFLFPSPFLPMDLVKAAVELLLSLGVMVIPSTGEIVIKGLPFEGDLAGVTDMLVLAGTLKDMLDAMEVVDEDGNPTGQKLVKWDASFVAMPNPEQGKINALEAVLSTAKGKPTPMFQKIIEGLEHKGPLLALPKTASRVAKVVAAEPLYMFDSTPDRIRVGDWVVAEFSDGFYALNIDRIDKFIDEDKTESFALSFANLPVTIGELKRVHADFRGELVPYEANINLSPIDVLNFQLEQIPEGLKVGRDLLICGCGEPYKTRIAAINGNQISFDPPLSPCVAGKMIIHGNVVLAGHGESQPQKIIGSGNAAKTHQEFVLEIAGLAFIPDSTKSAGVAAAIEVEVEGRVWEQVSSLKDSLADDHHYETRMTEEGFVKIIFGDGRNGRRLPTGKNNIRVCYRVGSGISGNLSADSLNKALKPNPLIESLAQPVACGGGGDMEDSQSLRENAPPTLLALQRAVSLSDFSHLAAAQSSIWQAKAFSELLHAGRMQKVIVIAVPAGGVPFTDDSDVKKNLESYLQKHALPAVQVCVESFNPKPVDITVTIRVDSAAYIAQDIEAAVRAELIRQLALQYRGLGQPLYLSEIYKIVENIEGVENSICKLNEGATVVRADDRSTVVHLDVTAGSSLVISSEEYRP